MGGFTPAYMEPLDVGLLRERAVAAVERLASCSLCPWRCGVDRLEDERGVCRMGRYAAVANYGPHLRLPLVYNTGGYDSVQTLRLLDGIVDIYMPDMKYGSADIVLKYSKIRNYSQVNRAAVKEMHRQVGDLKIDSRGIAKRGLLVRHLVLPGGLAGTDAVVEFLAGEISTGTWLNVMDQYYPTYRASEYPELNRRITGEEHRAALEMARRAGLARLEG